MFGSKNSRLKKLEKQYKKLLDESFRLSRTDRKRSDEMLQEAEKVRKQLDDIKHSAE